MKIGQPVYILNLTKNELTCTYHTNINETFSTTNKLNEFLVLFCRYDFVYKNDF